MKKLIAMIALAAICTSTATVYASAPVKMMQDTTKKDTSKMKTKKMKKMKKMKKDTTKM